MFFKRNFNYFTLPPRNTSQTTAQTSRITGATVSQKTPLLYLHHIPEQQRCK